MQAKDIMTVRAITIGPDAGIQEIASLLLAHRISGVPVVDSDGKLLGVVTEGDLIHRTASDDAAPERRSWWLRALCSDSESEARDVIKRHAKLAKDLMTADVVTVEESTPAGAIASLLERHRIKRVPVVRDGRVVGIVSRANLLQALAASKDALTPEVAPDDATIRAKVLGLLEESWITHGALNVMVNDGRVEIWGWVESDEEAHAIEVAAADMPGVKSVEAHLARYRYAT